MAFTVAILAQKGGTRKTTIARAVGVAFTKGGWNTVVRDMDPGQASAVSWNLRRQARDITPALAIEKHAHVSTVLAGRDDYDMVIIDGKGYSSKETAEVAQASDLILIPSGTGLDDLEPSVSLALSLVQEFGIDPTRILFPLTNMGKSQVDVAEARIYLDKAGFQSSPGHISFMTCYSQAHDQGRAITEVGAPGPKKQANEWIRGIIERIEQLAA
jgi:chromosome partitioning protein